MWLTRIRGLLAEVIHEMLTQFRGTAYTCQDLQRVQSALQEVCDGRNFKQIPASSTDSPASVRSGDPHASRATYAMMKAYGTLPAAHHLALAKCLGVAV